MQVLTLNLCGFDPGLEAGSRLPIKSNLVFNLSSALKRYHAYVCQTTYKRLKNRFRSKGFWPKYWVGFLTVRRNQFIRLATNLKLWGRYVHVFRFNVHAQNYEKPSIVHLKFDFQVGHWNQKTILTIGQKCALTRPGLNPYLHYTYSKVSIKHLFLLKDRVWIFSRSLY